MIRGRFWSHLVSTFKKKRKKEEEESEIIVILFHYALRGIEYFICIVGEVSSKEILCFIYDRVVSPCWFFFFIC